MVHIRQPFFSIATAVIFAALGFAFAMSAYADMPAMLGGAELSASVATALSGLMLLMAYFSLVHLKHES